MGDKTQVAAAIASHISHYSVIYSVIYTKLTSYYSRVLLISMKVKTGHSTYSHFVPHAMPFPKLSYFHSSPFISNVGTFDTKQPFLQ